MGTVHYRHTQGVRCCGFTSCQHCFQVGQWELYTTDTHRELGVVGLHPVNTVTRSDSGTCTIHTYVHREFGVEGLHPVNTGHQVRQWNLYNTYTHRELGVVKLHPVHTGHQVGQWDLYTTDTHRELGVDGLHPVNTATRSDSGTCTLHTYTHTHRGS